MSEDVSHAKEVVNIRMGKYDVLEPLDGPNLQKVKKTIIRAVGFGQVTIDQNPSITRQIEQDSIPVPTREDVALHSEGRFRSGDHR